MERLIVASLCRKCSFCDTVMSWITLPLRQSAVTLSLRTTQVFQEKGSSHQEIEESEIENTHPFNPLSFFMTSFLKA